MSSCITCDTGSVVLHRRPFYVQLHVTSGTCGRKRTRRRRRIKREQQNKNKNNTRLINTQLRKPTRMNRRRQFRKRIPLTCYKPDGLVSVHVSFNGRPAQTNLVRNYRADVQYVYSPCGGQLVSMRSLKSLTVGGRWVQVCSPAPSPLQLTGFGTIPPTFQGSPPAPCKALCVLCTARGGPQWQHGVQETGAHQKRDTFAFKFQPSLGSFLAREYEDRRP